MKRLGLDLPAKVTLLYPYPYPYPYPNPYPNRNPSPGPNSSPAFLYPTFTLLLPPTLAPPLPPKDVDGLFDSWDPSGGGN